jgi:hypothetical protein
MLYIVFMSETQTTTRQATDYIAAGYADFKNHTPWSRCPMSHDEWRAGAAETKESSLYWKGFDSGAKDAFATAQRKVRAT